MVAVSALVFGARESFASPLPHFPALGILSYRAPASQCSGFEGNPDLYGLGIRVGVYLQWVSGVVAHSFHADSVPDLLATNTIFLLALFIALAIITAKKIVQAIEVAILLQFCFGFLTTVSSTWGIRVRSRLKSPGVRESSIIPVIRIHH